MINKGVMVMKISTYLTFCLCAVALMTTSTSFAHEFTDVTVECTDGDNVRRIDWVTGMETVKWRGNSCKVVLATDEKLILTGKKCPSTFTAEGKIFDSYGDYEDYTCKYDYREKVGE